MIPDIMTNKKFHAILKELFIRSRKLNVSLVFITLVFTKITDKITSLGKSRNKEKENGINEPQEIIIPPEKRQQTIDDLRLF